MSESNKSVFKMELYPLFYSIKNYVSFYSNIVSNSWIHLPYFTFGPHNLDTLAISNYLIINQYVKTSTFCPTSNRKKKKLKYIMKLKKYKEKTTTKQKTNKIYFSTITYLKTIEMWSFRGGFERKQVIWVCLNAGLVLLFWSICNFSYLLLFFTI